MRKKFNLLIAQKKGQSNTKVDNLILVVIILVLVAQLAPIALVTFWNGTGVNDTWFGVPAWVPTTLGLLAVVAFIYIIWRAAQGAK